MARCFSGAAGLPTGMLVGASGLCVVPYNQGGMTEGKKSELRDVEPGVDTLGAVLVEENVAEATS